VVPAPIGTKTTPARVLSAVEHAAEPLPDASGQRNALAACGVAGLSSANSMPSVALPACEKQDLRPSPSM
jgi:hypothetical protein